MNMQKYLNRKYLITGTVIALVLLLFVYIREKNMQDDDSKGNEFSVVEDSIKKQALEDAEDLINVDYSKYYDKLKNHGEWIHVNPKEYMESNKDKSNSIADKISEYFLNAAGVNNAYASDDFYFSSFLVWRPSPGFAVGIVAGEPEPVFTPYKYGRWMYTDHGWYFRADTYESEIVHHYGRWVFVPAAGWIWIPGRKWSPAWVHWEYDDDYIAWSPLVPNIYYVSNYVHVPPAYIRVNFTAVERKYFVNPGLHRYVFSGRSENFVIKEKLKIKGDKYLYSYSIRNSGPRFKTFDKNIVMNMKPGDVDFLNRNKNERTIFKNNNEPGRKYADAENYIRDNNGSKNKSRNELKQNKNKGNEKDLYPKERYRKDNKKEKQQNDVSGGKVNEKRKERVTDNKIEKRKEQVKENRSVKNREYRQEKIKENKTLRNDRSNPTGKSGSKEQNVKKGNQERKEMKVNSRNENR